MLKLISAVRLLSDKPLIRAAVLLAPGLIAVKATSYFAAPQALSKAAFFLLLIGGVVYAAWGFIQKKLLEKNEDIDAEEDAVEDESFQLPPAGYHQSLIDQLLKWTDGNASEVLERIAAEAAVNFDESYLAAIERAVARKEFEINRQSGNSKPQPTQQDS